MFLNHTGGTYRIASRVAVALLMHLWLDQLEWF